MAWKCKKCGAEIVQIDVVPCKITREIKENGKTGKIIEKEDNLIDDRYYKCLSCKKKANGLFINSLKTIAEWSDD